MLDNIHKHLSAIAARHTRYPMDMEIHRVTVSTIMPGVIKTKLKREGSLLD